jgi:MoxR-like ATPase
VLNEIDHVGADAESFLHNFLDDHEMARVYLPNGEELKPGDIQVIATMNGEPDDLAEALKDRFTVKVKIEEPHPEALASLPVSLREFAKRMICDPPKNQERMSLRAFMDFVALTKNADPAHGGITQAARAMFAARGDDVVQALKVATTK